MPLAFLGPTAHFSARSGFSDEFGRHITSSRRLSGEANVGALLPWLAKGIPHHARIFVPAQKARFPTTWRTTPIFRQFKHDTCYDRSDAMQNRHDVIRIYMVFGLARTGIFTLAVEGPTYLQASSTGQVTPTITMPRQQEELWRPLLAQGIEVNTDEATHFDASHDLLSRVDRWYFLGPAWILENTTVDILAPASSTCSLLS